MLPKARFPFLSNFGTFGWFILLPAISHADPLSKENNSDNLNLPSSWIGGAVPGTLDIATWDSSVTAANTVLLGADLSFAGLSILNPAGAVSISAGNTLTLGASGIGMGTATQDLTLASGLALGVNQTWNVGTGRTLATSGLSSGAGTITKTGDGIWRLNAVAGNTGGVILAGGSTVLNTGNFANAFAGSIEFRNGAALTSVLAAGNTATINSNIFVDAGQSGTINTGNRMAFGFNNSSLAITGSGALTINNQGSSNRVDIQMATNAFAGTLTFTGAGAVRNARLRDNGGDWNGFTAARLEVEGTAVLTPELFTSGGTYGIGALAGASSAAIVNGSNTAGVLIWSIGSRNLDTSYAGQINGNAAVTKIGTATQAFSGSLAYTGATNVTGGKLLFNGAKTGAGVVNVNTTGTLGGTGSFAGLLTIGAGGTLAPGESIESLRGGALTFINSSTYAFEIDSSAAPGAAADLFVAGGDLSLTGTVTLSLADIATTDTAFAAGTTLTLINYTGLWNGGLLTVGGNALADGATYFDGLNEWQIDYDATSGGANFIADQLAGSFVNLTVVPEPSVVLLGCAGFLGLLRRRR